MTSIEKFLACCLIAAVAALTIAMGIGVVESMRQVVVRVPLP